MKARDVMTAPAITLRPDTPVRAAAALLISHGFAAAPVVDTHRRVLGVVTEADLMRGLVVPDGWAVYGIPGAEQVAHSFVQPVTNLWRTGRRGWIGS